ncbi:hypothetical protein [Vreelandella rituensis]|nr:hypothetical protein [Halomonas rituensis]
MSNQPIQIFTSEDGKAHLEVALAHAVNLLSRTLTNQRLVSWG